MASDLHPPDLILAESAWLQRFARSLVRNKDLAEDLCQDTWLANLKRNEQPSRSWLSRVLRNLAINILRRDARRPATERFTDGQDPNPDTADVVAEAELQRKAVDALMRLAEPYRSTLLLRFMKGFSYRDVAAQTRVPIETVRTRIKRGLTQLRDKLDSEHGGRRGWLPPLAPPSFGIGTAALWGIVVMNMQTKLVLAGTGLAAVLLTIWFVAMPTGSLPVPDNRAARVSPLTANLAERETDIPIPERERVEEGPADRAGPNEEVGSLLVRLSWHDTKQPAAGLPLHISRDSVFEPPWQVHTGDDGTVLVEDLPPGSFRIWTNRAFYDREGMSQIGTTFDLEPGEAEVVEHEIAPGVDIQGQVVDRYGRPVPGAEVLGVFKGFIPQRSLVVARTDTSGSFSARALGTGYALGARAEGLGVSDFVYISSLDHSPERNPSVTIQLPDEDPAILAGEVFDPDGRPVRAARVTIGKGILGRITLPGGRPGQLPPRSHLLTDEGGSFHIRDLRSGLTPVAVYAKGLAPWSGEVELHTGELTQLRVDLRAGASLSGTARDATGTPLDGVIVLVTPADYPFRAISRTDALGRYEIRDLPSGEFEVRATIPFGKFAPANRTLIVAGAEVIEWEVTLEASSAHARGRVLLPDGMPAADVTVTLHIDHMGVATRARTDGDGDFAFGPVPPGVYTPKATAAGLVDAEFGEITLLPQQQLDLGTRMLEHGGELRVTLDASPERLEGVKVVLLDPKEDRSLHTGIISEGHAVFRTLRAGSYRLSVTSADGEPHVQNVEIKSQETLEVTVTLR